MVATFEVSVLLTSRTPPIARVGILVVGSL